MVRTIPDYLNKYGTSLLRQLSSPAFRFVACRRRRSGRRRSCRRRRRRRRLGRRLPSFVRARPPTQLLVRLEQGHHWPLAPSGWCLRPECGWRDDATYQQAAEPAHEEAPGDNLPHCRDLSSLSSEIVTRSP